MTTLRSPHPATPAGPATATAAAAGTAAAGAGAGANPPGAGPGPAQAGRRPPRNHTVDSFRGWVVVGAAALAAFTCFAITYSFGTAFLAIATEFNASSSAIALMFSMVIFFLFVMGLPAGRICDRVGPRPVMAVGAVSMTVGLVLTSLIHSLVVGWITYGVGVGFAVACCYVPLMAQVGGWFQKYRAGALGLASAGIGLGTFVGPIVTEHLVHDHGWRTTFRIQAVFGAAALSLATALAARAPGSAGAPLAPLKEVFSRPRFGRLYLSGLLLGLGLFVPFVFLAKYAKVHGVSAGAAATLVSMLGLGSLSGRLVLSVVAGRLGLARLYKLCILIMGGCFLIWLFAGSSFLAMSVFAVVLGLSYGGYVALSPAVCAQLFGVVGLAGVLGALYTSSGIGGLFGPVIAGWLIDNHGYTSAIVFALVLASLAVVALPRLDDAPAVAGAGASRASPQAAPIARLAPAGRGAPARPDGSPNGHPGGAMAPARPPEARAAGGRPPYSVWPAGEVTDAAPFLFW